MAKQRIQLRIRGVATDWGGVLMKLNTNKVWRSIGGLLAVGVIAGTVSFAVVDSRSADVASGGFREAAPDVLPAGVVNEVLARVSAEASSSQRAIIQKNGGPTLIDYRAATERAVNCIVDSIRTEAAAESMPIEVVPRLETSRDSFAVTYTLEFAITDSSASVGQAALDRSTQIQQGCVDKHSAAVERAYQVQYRGDAEKMAEVEAMVRKCAGLGAEGGEPSLRSQVLEAAVDSATGSRTNARSSAILECSYDYPSMLAEPQVDPADGISLYTSNPPD